MATIVGDALLFILGNPDVLKVWSVFAGCVGLLMAVVYMYKQIDDWRR